MKAKDRAGRVGSIELLGGSEIGDKLLFYVLQANAPTIGKALSGSCDSSLKPWVVLETVIEPVVFGRESDQHPGRLPMTGNDDLLLLCSAEVLRELVLDFIEGDSLHVTCLPFSTSHPLRLSE